MGKIWDQEVTDDNRHLNTSKSLRRMVKLVCFWSKNYSCCGPGNDIPINLLIKKSLFLYILFLSP